MPWTPPESPDPDDILNSAQEDARNGAHADALAKHLWYHHHALRHRPSHTGVRLSYALVAWLELGESYPPAREAFVRTRDETDAAFAADPLPLDTEVAFSNPAFDLFHDLSAFNRYLGDQVRTADAFAAAVRRNPAVGDILYRVAEPSLIAVGRFAECGPFLDPARRAWYAHDAYKVMKRFEDGEAIGANAPPKFAREMYVKDIAVLVALLVLTNRGGEVAAVRRDALAVVDDDDFRAMLDAAATGHLPQQIL